MRNRNKRLKRRREDHRIFTTTIPVHIKKDKNETEGERTPRVDGVTEVIVDMKLLKVCRLKFGS